MQEDGHDADGDPAAYEAPPGAAPQQATPKRKPTNNFLHSELGELQHRRQLMKKEKMTCANDIKKLQRKRSRLLKKVEGLSVDEMAALTRAKAATLVPAAAG